MIKVIIPKDSGVETSTPDQEVKKAAKNCLESLKHPDREYIFPTVSPDAVGTYSSYGKDKLGLDIHFILNGKDVSCEKIFKFLNKSFDILEKLCAK